MLAAALVALLAGAAHAQFVATTFEENVPITPQLTPDNTVSLLQSVIDGASTSVDLTVQYIHKFDDDDEWADDENPLLRALVRAAERGVRVRVLLEDDADSDAVEPYLEPIVSAVAGGGVRFIGDSVVDWNHNKGLVIDGARVSVSSANWSKTALTSNREVGVLLQSNAIGALFTEWFEEDYDNGISARRADRASNPEPLPEPASAVATRDYTPLDDIPSFSGPKKIVAFSNPDSAFETVLSEFANAKTSISAEIYSISSSAIVNQLINLKRLKPEINIRLIVSYNRATASENSNTNDNVELLEDAFINVYRSSSDLGFTHAKYWVVDGTRTTVYTGNWAGTSVTSGSGTTNREWGLIVEDADTAAFFEDTVFELDLELAELWSERSTSIRAFPPLNGILPATEDGKLFFAASTVNVNSVDGVLDAEDGKCKLPLIQGETVGIFQTAYAGNLACGGMHTIDAQASASDGASTVRASMTFNVIDESLPWAVLITEVLYNGATEGDDEYVSITNMYGFDLSIGGWALGSAIDDNDIFVFPDNTVIESGETIIVAQSKVIFSNNFPGTTANFEWEAISLKLNDMVILFDGSDPNFARPLDAVVWGTATLEGHTAFAEDVENMETIRRDVSGPDTNDCSVDFVLSATPAPKELLGPAPTPDTCDRAASLKEVCKASKAKRASDKSGTTYLGMDEIPFFATMAGAGLCCIGSCVLAGPRLYKLRKERKESKMYSMFQL